MGKQGNSNCSTGLHRGAEHTGLLLRCCCARLSWGRLCSSAAQGQGSDPRQRDRAAREPKRGNWERQGKASVRGEGEPCRTAMNKLGATAPSTLQSMNYWKMGKHGRSCNDRMQLNCPLSVFFLVNWSSQENCKKKNLKMLVCHSEVL